MSLALFGVVKRRKNRSTARDSSTTQPSQDPNVDPALAALVKKFAAAVNILAPGSLSVDPNAHPGSYSSLFDTSAINQSIQNVNLLGPGELTPAASMDVAVLLATGHQLPRTMRSAFSKTALREIQKTFGNVIEREQRPTGKNPFESTQTDPNAISQAQWNSMIQQAESMPTQSSAQRQNQQSNIDELYRDWLKDFGLQDNAKSQKVWKMLLKAGHTGAGGIVKVVPHSGPALSNQVAAQLAIQDAKNKAAQAASALSTAQMSNQSAATIAQLAANTDAANKTLYSLVAAFDAMTTSSGSYQQGPASNPYTSPGLGPNAGPQMPASTPNPIADNWYLPEEEAPPASGSGSWYDQAAAAHGLNGIDNLTEVLSVYPGVRSRFSGLGKAPRRRQIAVARDDETALPISLADAQQLLALIIQIVEISGANQLNTSAGFSESKHFSHADVVAADKFGKAIASVAIKNKDFLSKLSALAQGAGAVSPAMSVIFSAVPKLSVTTDQLISDVAAGYQNTPSSGASGGGSVSNMSIDETNTDYNDQTYYQRMVELQTALNTGLDLVLKNQALDLAIGAKKSAAEIKDLFDPKAKATEKSDYKLIKILFDGIEKASKLRKSLEKGKKQSIATRPRPSAPIWNIPAAPVIAMTPAFVSTPVSPAGFRPSTPPQLQPIGGGMIIEDPIDQPDQPTQQPAPPPDNTFLTGLDALPTTGLILAAVGVAALVVFGRRR